MNILRTNVPVDHALVHVAPGGSVRITITGESSTIAPFLRSLMCDVAYGMISIEADVPHNVKVEIYMGRADESAFDEAVANAGASFYSVERAPIEEDDDVEGYSMSTRNNIIAALR